MELSQPRGIRDIEPEEYEVHQRIRAAFEQVARAYDFKGMEPGPLETLAILRAKSGSQVDEQIYAFRDKADREIGLRFDLTVGMTRYVASKKGLRPPIKLASYGGVWRYDEPQHARYRWFYQWDVEVYGEPSLDADAEVIDLTHGLFKRLELRNFSIQVGDRRVVEEYIRKQLRISSEEKVVDMMRLLDKVAKKTEEELVKEYEPKGVTRDELHAVLEFGRTKGTPEKVLARLDELGLESAADLSELASSLKTRGMSDVEYNLSIVRGIDYYTAVVFEVVDREHPDLGSLCGGGRYDALPKLLGRPDLAATGAAGGVERIALSLSKPDDAKDKSVYVAYTEPGMMPGALAVLASLRTAGIRSEIGQRGKTLGKQLEDASSRGFNWVVIAGKREAEQGLVVLRDMKERKEEKVPPDKVVATLGH